MYYRQTRRVVSRQYYMASYLWHRIFQKVFHAQNFLQTDAFAHRRFYTQTLLHTDAITHRRFYTQTLLHTEGFTHRDFYTQTLLHTNTFTHRSFYTQTLLHTDAFTHKSLHTNSFTHKHFYTETLLHTEAFTHRRYYTQTLLHTEAFTHRRFYTHRNFTSVFGDPTSFRAKGTCERVALLHTGQVEIAILPQFLAIEPHFVRKGSPETRNRNFTSVFGDRTSFRAKGLRRTS